jgi:hypothetical protein
MKKMSEAKKLKPGPKRKLSDSARRKNKKAANAKLNKNRIYIGDEYDRWMEIKTAFRLERTLKWPTSFSFRFTFHYFPFDPRLKIIFP